ncbi:hypothetical protein [Rhodococcus tukisamuensis]|uniref:MspA protein n=1 Tax=Rhodococcus tukisamuensis TaxID=168276 RepID=A0A1G6T5R8_9NOCA|nr:hypothetical protein [Rhodococcus tukisamuensis]SDD23807.1 hypothetical protein SAMN05444580_103389 [Rhodococcus tukisamuensis]
MKRSIIVALAGATIALGTVASASAAPVDPENPFLPAPWAGSSSGSIDFLYPHDGQNPGSVDFAQDSGSNDLASDVAWAPFEVLCVLLGGKTIMDCVPQALPA